MRICMLIAAFVTCMGLATHGHAQFLAESLGFNVPCDDAKMPICKSGKVAKVSQGICYGYVCSDKKLSVSGEECPAVVQCPAGIKGRMTKDARGCEQMDCTKAYKTQCEVRDTVECPRSQKPLATENYDQDGCTIYICQSEDLLNNGSCPAQPTCGAGYMQTYIKTNDGCAEVVCRGINKTNGAACPVPSSCPAGYEESGETWNGDCPTKKCRAKDDAICRSKIAGPGIITAKQCPRLFGLPATIESHETLPAPKAPVVEPNRNFGGR